jgi:nitrogen fixation NifU-like protein
MSDLGLLYQGVILDHCRRPRNRRALDGANRRAEGQGLLCGDSVTVCLRVEEGVIRDVAFEARGCAVAIASASMMTVLARGRRIGEVMDLFDGLCRRIRRQPAAGPDPDELAALAGVSEFPARVECALLAWRTLEDALKGGDGLPAARAGTIEDPGRACHVALTV